MIGGRKVLAIYAVMLLNSTCGFVVQPHLEYYRIATKTTSLLEMSTQSFEPKKKNNFLQKGANVLANVFTPWWLKHKGDATKDGKKADIEVVLSPSRIENKLAKKQLHDTLQQFPWPIKTMGDSIVKSISLEQRKAKPLLHDAQAFIRRDLELMDLLGSPVHIKPIFSRSTSTSTINWKQTRRIVEKFVVKGSKKNGVATLIADKYAKGHVKALRVDVEGIHFDVDLT